MGSINKSSVTVIGGGPAGSAVARMLAVWGHDVVLLTRTGNPERAIAESLPPTCVRLLERVGMRTAVDAAGFVRSTGNTVSWGSAEERVERFSAGTYGYQVDRNAFDAVMLAEVVAAGVDVRQGTMVLDVHRASGARDSSVRFEHQGESHVAESRSVLDCTGRTGLVARRGWRQPEPGARTMAIVGVWDREDHWPPPIADETHTFVESYEGGWGWSVPVSPTRRYVTLMVDPSLTSLGGRELLATYDAELARTTGLRRLVVGANRKGRPFARDASSYTARRFGEQGTLLVGDAASFVDPLSSYGVKKALASAWLAAVVTHTCLTDPAMEDAALALYESREREMYATLRRRLGDLSRDAGAAHPEGYWSARTEADSADDPDRATRGEPDVAALRVDADVLRTLKELQERESIRLSPGSSVLRVGRATVRGNRVVMEDHLVVPAFPDGVRYVRNIDLVRLSELAVAHDQVPDLFDAYNRAAPPAPLPDFLGALALLIGKGFLTFA